MQRTGRRIWALAILLGLSGCGGGDAPQGVPPGGGAAPAAPSTAPISEATKQKFVYPSGMEPADSKAGR